MISQRPVVTTSIVIILFNRSDLAELLIKQLSKFAINKLYVVMDGPRENNEKDIDERNKILQILENIDFVNNIILEISDKNLGCTNRIVSGLNNVFRNEDSAIILEDDCIPSDTFFNYCEHMLETYREDTRIGVISGTNLVENSSNENSYHFSKYCNIWGWATWRRVWDEYDVKMNLLNEENLEKIRGRFNSRNEFNYWKAVFNQTKNGNIKTWDYQLWFSVWLNGQISIVPSVNQIDNLGFAHENATHTIGKHPAETIKARNLKFPLLKPESILPDAIQDDKIRILLYQFPNIIIRIKSKILRLFSI